MSLERSVQVAVCERLRRDGVPFQCYVNLPKGGQADIVTADLVIECKGLLRNAYQVRKAYEQIAGYGTQLAGRRLVLALVRPEIFPPDLVQRGFRNIVWDALMSLPCEVWDFGMNELPVAFDRNEGRGQPLQVNFYA